MNKFTKITMKEALSKVGSGEILGLTHTDADSLCEHPALNNRIRRSRQGAYLYL